MASGKAKTPKKFAVALNTSYGNAASPETVRNVVRHAGLKARKYIKKPALATQNRKLRLEFATSYKEWMIED